MVYLHIWLSTVVHSWYTIHKWKAVSHFGNMLNLTAMVSYFCVSSSLCYFQLSNSYTNPLAMHEFEANCRLPSFVLLFSKRDFVLKAVAYF